MMMMMGVTKAPLRLTNAQVPLASAAGQQGSAAHGVATGN